MRHWLRIAVVMALIAIVTLALAQTTTQWLALLEGVVGFAQTNSASISGLDALLSLLLNLIGIVSAVVTPILVWAGLRQRASGNGHANLPPAPPTSVIIREGVAGLPDHYVERTAILDELREALTRPGQHATAITALQGMGGIGKTVLAQALAQDAAVLARYPDGVLWAKLNERGGGRLAGELGGAARLARPKRLSTVGGQAAGRARAAGRSSRADRAG